MVNVAVFNLKDLAKYILKLCVVAIMLFSIVKIYGIVKSGTLTKIIDKTIPAIAYVNNKENVDKVVEEIKNISFSEYILDTQFAMKNSIFQYENNIVNEVEENAVYEVAQDTEEPLSEAQTNVTTQVITDNNIEASYTNIYDSIEINNSSKYELTEEILTPNVKLTNKKDIIIFHTHTCESYTPTEKYNYDMLGSYRTTDLNYSVARVGDELQRYLEQKRI